MLKYHLMIFSLKNQSLYIIFIGISILFLPSYVYAATWYVRPATTTATYGSENGTSYSNAWNGFSDIVQGVGGVVSGDTLYLDGSATYHNILSWKTSGTDGNPIIIDGSYTGGDAIIDGQNTRNIGIVESGNNVIFSHLRIVNNTASGVYVYNATSSIVFDKDTFIQNNKGISFSSSKAHSIVTIKNSTFINNATAGVRYLVDTDGLTSSDWVVSGNSFSGGQEGVRLSEESGAPNSSFSNISFHNNTFSGGILRVAIQVSNPTNAGAFTNNDVQVYDNTISNVGTGITLRGFDSSTGDYTKNIIYGNTITSTTRPSGPMDLFYMRYIDVYGNTVSNGVTSTVDSNGILIDNGNDNVRVHDNTINNMVGSNADNSGVGIMVLTSSNVAVYSNKGQGNKNGIWYGGGGQSNVSFFNNSFLDNSASGLWISAPEDANDLAQLTVKDNILTGDGSGYGLNNLSTGNGDSSWDNNLLSDFSTNYVNHVIGIHDILSNPLINYSSVPTLTQFSKAIDTGSTTYITTDILGNPIYGAPDIGAYEYQPPYTFSADSIPTNGSIRLYTNGKYRMTNATSSVGVAAFSVTPVGGVYTASTSEYMDISIKKWTPSDKQWIATSTPGQFNTHATSTVYTVGDLTPNKYYTFSLDGIASSTAIADSSQCTDGVCGADSSGNLTFTYVGGYSTHTFDLSIPTTSPSAFTLNGPVKMTMSSSADLSWSPPSSSVGLSKYILYVDGVLAKDNLPPTVTSTKLPKTYSCNELHTWKIDAIDNNGKVTSSNEHTFDIPCAGSSSSVSSGYTTVLPSYTPIIQNVVSTSTASSTILKQSNTTKSSAAKTENIKIKQNLNAAQISAIISLLKSFGVDEKTVENVRYALTGIATHATAKVSFKRNLAMYDTGLQVKRLQQFLNQRGFVLSNVGPGSSGSETEYFGPKTYRALVRYQRSAGLPSTGWFGPMTRATIR